MAEIKSLKVATIELTDAEQKNLIDQFIKDNHIKDIKIFNEWAIKNHGSPEQFEDNLLNSFRFRRLCKKNYFHKAEERYLKRKASLDQVVYSLIRVKEPFLAKELYLQITSNEKDFGDLASQFSEGEEKKSRGIVGPVSLSQSHPKIMEFLKSAEINDVSTPTQVDKWNVIIRLESLIESNLDEFMKQQMSEEIFAELIEEEATEKVNELLTEAEII